MIVYEPNNKVFYLHTPDTSYIMSIYCEKYLSVRIKNRGKYLMNVGLYFDNSKELYSEALVFEKTDE